MKALLAIALALIPGMALAEMSTKVMDVSYEDCLALITMTAVERGVTPKDIVKTGAMRLVRFPSEDGSVMIKNKKPPSMRSGR